YAHAARMTAKRGEFARTRAFATQGLRLDAKVAPLWALLSDCDDHDGREAEARIELEHALALHPEQIERGYEKLVALDTRAGQSGRADSVAARAPESLRPMLHDYVTGQEARARGDQAAACAALHRAAMYPTAPIPVVMEWGRAELDASNFAAADSAFRLATRL